MEFKPVKIRKPEDVNVIIGQSHFIKTVEDIYEALAGSSPGIRFGLAFAESSGACKIRVEGNDADLKELAAENALEVGAGHSFFVFIRQAFPINCLNAIKMIPEVCNIYCASSNPLEVIVAETETGRGIMGVIDGFKPKGLESDGDVSWRHNFLRQTGYKL
ncbi:MAG: adenosine-specific kinase [Candidatus Omnitrophota bacterium]